MTTDLVARPSLDLSRAPDEQWNEEMVKMVTSQLFRGRADITRGAVYYCLSVAEGLGLNPLVGEVYFIPAKSKDGEGPTLQPYIGRNGLVKKAAERGYYFESDTVRANDRFRMTRKKDGTVEVTHSYGSQERGKIVGAYALLHSRTNPQEHPAFFYAEWDQYVPTFDQAWKFDKSPWGNQGSAMIEKCAMIGAGRKRLDLGHVLMDGEVARYEQQGQVGPPGGGGEPAEAVAFDWESLDAPAELVARLRVAVERVSEIDPMEWPAAKLEMVLSGQSKDELVATAEMIEETADRLASARVGGAEGHSGGGAGDSPSGGDPAVEGVTDAVVVDDEPRDLGERAAGLLARKAQLEDDLNDPTLDQDDAAQLHEELEGVERELAAAENAGQEQMPL